MTISVGMGIAAFPFADAGGFWRWVDLCEAGGVDSIWQSDRLIGTVPALECISVMAALAGRTRRLKFGMNVLSLAQRDPVLVAKQCATIDVLSEGRLLPAFGIGSPAGPEWRALALDTRSRGKRMDESLEIVSRLWREDSVDFDGVHFKLKGASISPKPVQAELPMWIGGSSDAAIRRTGRYGTGWQAGLDSLDVELKGQAAFDPFLIGGKATATAQVPETKLPGVPLPSGLGTLIITIEGDSVVTSDFSGVCAAVDGGKLLKPFAGLRDVSTRWVVTHDLTQWKSEIAWMSLYFSAAVWASLALCVFFALESHLAVCRGQILVELLV